MNVISASRRTDIPALYSDWFMNRIRDRKVQVKSPFGGKLFEVSLDPNDVVAIVFWTKNAAPLLYRLEELRQSGHCFTFLYTINNYQNHVEPNVPSLTHTMKVLERLSKLFPSCTIRWRYDTIVMSDRLDVDWHLKNFEHLCGLTAAHTKECIFSFCDYYRKTIRNMKRYLPEYFSPSEADCMQIANNLADIASSRNIELKSCAHDFLAGNKVSKARCIDPNILLNVVDSPRRREAVEKLKFVPTRKDCGCAASRDIGAYDSCNHGCVYCYANSDSRLSAVNMLKIGDDQVCLDPTVGPISRTV